jgi:hypothetical protein
LALLNFYGLVFTQKVLKIADNKSFNRNLPVRQAGITFSLPECLSAEGGIYRFLAV